MQSAAAAFASTCSADLHPTTTLLTAGWWTHQASAQVDMGSRWHLGAPDLLDQFKLALDVRRVLPGAPVVAGGDARARVGTCR
jgi:hypothetical protein